MKAELIALGIHQAIVNNFQKFNFDKSKDGILELECNNGEFAAFLKEQGVAKYHGTDNNPDNIEACKAAVDGYSRRFHVADPTTEEALSHKSDLLVCTDIIPWDKIKSGQAIAVVTKGFKDWGDACLALAPLVAEGAGTIQFNDYFLTVGYRK